MRVTGQGSYLGFPPRISDEEEKKSKEDGQQVEEVNPTKQSEINTRREFRVDLERGISSYGTEKSNRSSSRVAGVGIGIGASIVVGVAVAISFSVAAFAKILAPLIVLVGWVIAPTTTLSAPKFGFAITSTFMRLTRLGRSVINLVTLLVVSWPRNIPDC